MTVVVSGSYSSSGRSSSSTSGSGCGAGLLPVAELVSLVEVEEDGAAVVSVIFSPRDKAIALINSSCSPPLPEGLRGPEPEPGAVASGPNSKLAGGGSGLLLPVACLKDGGGTGLFSK